MLWYLGVLLAAGGVVQAAHGEFAFAAAALAVRVHMKNGSRRSINRVSDPEQLANYVAAWARATRVVSPGPQQVVAQGAWMPPVQRAR
jgi:hypothetical protein